MYLARAGFLFGLALLACRGAGAGIKPRPYGWGGG